MSWCTRIKKPIWGSIGDNKMCLRGCFLCLRWQPITHWQELIWCAPTGWMTLDTIKLIETFVRFWLELQYWFWLKNCTRLLLSDLYGCCCERAMFPCLAATKADVGTWVATSFSCFSWASSVTSFLWSSAKDTVVYLALTVEEIDVYSSPRPMKILRVSSSSS